MDANVHVHIGPMIGVERAHSYDMIVPGNAGVKVQSYHATAVGVNGDDGHCVATTGRFLLERPPHLVVHSRAERLPLPVLELTRMRHAVEDPPSPATPTLRPS
jgi:hypothetical protein